MIDVGKMCSIGSSQSQPPKRWKCNKGNRIGGRGEGGTHKFPHPLTTSGLSYHTVAPTRNVTDCTCKLRPMYIPVVPYTESAPNSHLLKLKSPNLPRYNFYDPHCDCRVTVVYVRQYAVKQDHEILPVNFDAWLFDVFVCRAQRHPLR